MWYKLSFLQMDTLFILYLFPRTRLKPRWMDKTGNNCARVITEQVSVNHQHSNQTAQPEELTIKSRKGGAKQ